MSPDSPKGTVRRLAGLTVVVAACALLAPGLAGAATHLNFVVQPANTRAGDLFQVQVEARNADNTRDSAFTGNITLTAATVGGSNFTAGNVQAASQGLATFNVFLNNAANGYQITASASALTSATSSLFNVTATFLAVTTVITNKQAGETFNVQVEGRDANNSLAENFGGTVSLSAAAAGGSNFNGGTASASAAAGTATFNSRVLSNAANNYAVTASSTGLTSGLSNSFNVTAAFLAVNAIANVRSGDSFTVTVEGRDANNVVAENFTGSVSLSAAATGGSNFNGGTTSVSAVTGVATFTSRVLSNAADGYTATASSAGLTSGLSNSFNVTARSLVVVSVITNLKAGDLFTVSVEARDNNNAVAENFGGTVTLSAAATGGSSFASAVSQGAAFGSVTFNSLQLLNAANNYAVTASGTGLISGLSNSFNVTTAGLAIQAFGNPRSGQAFNAEVRAVDAQATPETAENFGGTVGLALVVPAGGSELVDTPAPKSAANGVATFDGLVLLNAADGYQLDASASGVTTGSRVFDVGPSALVFMTPATERVAGQGFSVEIEARDAENSIAENFDSAVQLSAAAPGAGSNFAGGTKTKNGAGGVVTFTGLKLDRAAKNYALTANAGGVVASTEVFDVVADVMSRSLTLKLSGRFATGAVRAGSGPRCKGQMTVRIQRKSGRRWVTVGIDTTTNAGAFREAIGTRPGKYRAVAQRATWPSPTTVCVAATSPTRIKR